MKNPAFSQKKTTLPKKLPELNIREFGGQQLTFRLLNLGLADIEADNLFKGRSQDEAALAFKSKFHLKEKPLKS